MSRSWTLPSVPKRRPGWETGFIAEIERHTNAPFAWGVSDCLIVPADLCRAMTGVDPMKGMRRYRTEDGAARLLATRGCHDAEDALALVFPRIAPAMAKRGDCGVIEQRKNGRSEKLVAIVLGETLMARSTKGAAFLPRTAMVRAYAIGAR